MSTSTTSVPSEAITSTARSQMASTSASTSAYPRVGDHATLSGGLGSSCVANHDASARGSERRSVGSGPTTTSSAATTSDSRRAIGPFVDRWCQSGASGPPLGTRPSEGFIVDRPQHEDGMRSEPPPSDPVASGTIPAAMAAALPPDEPPGVWSRFHGLRVGPNTSLSVSAFHPSSGVLVFPSTTQPAPTRRDTRAESEEAGGRSAKPSEPCVVT